MRITKLMRKLINNDITLKDLLDKYDNLIKEFNHSITCKCCKVNLNYSESNLENCLFCYTTINQK